MAVHSIIPNTNISFNDIRDTLNANGGSVTNDVITAFQERAKINVWSKHKPVHLPVDFCQDFDPSKPNYNPTWWKGANGYCGLIPKTISSYEQLPEIMDNEMNGWLYDKPKGGASSPYRLGDFSNYTPGATPLVSRFLISPQASNQFSSSKAIASAAINSTGEYVISFSDFPELKDYYFGVYLKQRNGTLSARATATQTLSNSTDVEIYTGGFPTGLWDAYPFIAQNKIGQNSPNSINKYYTCPNVSFSTTKIISSFLTLILNAIINTNGSVNWSLSVINSQSSSITVSNNYVLLRYAKNDFEDPLQIGERRIEIGTFVIPTGTTNNIKSGNFIGVDKEVLKSCKVWISLQSGQYLDAISPT